MHRNDGSDVPPAPTRCLRVPHFELTPDNVLGTIVLMAIAEHCNVDEPRETRLSWSEGGSPHAAPMDHVLMRHHRPPQLRMVCFLGIERRDAPDAAGGDGPVGAAIEIETVDAGEARRRIAKGFELVGHGRVSALG